MCLCIRLKGAGKWSCDRLTKGVDFRKKKSSFQMKLILIDVEAQNCRVWATENPHAYIEKPKHPKRITIWSGFWSLGIIGPFFFGNKQGEADTVNGDRYRALLNEFLFTKIEEEDIGNIWFQQDGGTCHTAEATCFWKSHYQPQSWCRLATSELGYDTVGLLFVGCRQR